MITAHWTIGNGSGMFRVAESMVKAEKELGLDARLVNLDKPETFALADDADIHVAHTHLSEQALYSGKPLVWIAHGTPEGMLHSSYEQANVNGGYGHGDAWMLAQFWMQRCDALVTFWPRHQRIWQSLCDKRTHVDCVPLGIDKSIWHPVPSAGKYVGTPSVFTAENPHELKWPMDLFILWPWVIQHPALHGARLHAIYVVRDQHRQWFPLVNRNGCSFASYISPLTFGPDLMKNALCSTDFYIGLVRYGDFNKMSLEAKACGAKLISYRGNPYADFWITEGDQRVMADELIEIFSGHVEPRSVSAIPDASEMAQEMKAIYERL